MKAAAALTSNHVLACREKLLRLAPEDPRWNAQIVPAAVKLGETMLPALSETYTYPLLAMWAAWWMWAGGCFAVSLALFDQPMLQGLMWGTTSFFAALPLFLALDVAKVSDDCEHVLDTLNHKRGAIMATTDLQDVEKIQLLETFFDRLNHQHGMGFVLHTPMGYAP